VGVSNVRVVAKVAQVILSTLSPGVKHCGCICAIAEAFQAFHESKTSGRKGEIFDMKSH
jgi:hypothetical protein